MVNEKKYDKDFAFSKEQLEEANSEVIEMYEQYQDGLITRNDYATYMITLLEDFVKQIVSLRFAGHGRSGDFNDFVQEGCVAIFSKIDEYDPYKTMPTTYFRYVIESVLRVRQTEINGDGISSYYKEMIINLDKVAKEYGYEDSLDPRLTEVRLHILSGVPLSTVSQALERKRRKNVNLETLENSLEHNYMSPEEQFIKNERTGELNDMVKDLPPLDLYILKRMVIDDDTASAKQVVKELSTPEAKEHFNLKKNPNIPGIQTNLSKTLMKLKKYDKKFTEYQRRVNYDYNSEVQADDECLLAACEEGSIFELDEDITYI